MNRIERGTIRSLWVAIPATAALTLVLVAGNPSPIEAALLLLLVVALTGAIWRSTTAQSGDLRTVGNLLDALREGDYGVRVPAPSHNHPIADIMRGFNELAARLQDEQRDLQQNLQLLSKTLAALDGAVFAFEQDQRLRLVNPAGERLLNRPAASLLGCNALELDLLPLFDLPSGIIQTHTFAGHSGRWQITHTALRSRSQQGRLLLIQPMERALREEEAQAFQRLLRVLGHEINNSMTPIVSMADTLTRMLPDAGSVLDQELDGDLHHGLELIGQRCAALQRFIGGYAQLAKLPPPKTRAVEISRLCRGVGLLLDNARISVENGDDLWASADPDQLEQVLINLLRNALEAGGDGPVMLRLRVAGPYAAIQVIDDGHGLPSSGNLFVPFFTTKADGAGIGLSLSRHIIEAQQGTLELQQRLDAPGTVAEILLPLSPAAP